MPRSPAPSDPLGVALGVLALLTPLLLPWVAGRTPSWNHGAVLLHNRPELVVYQIPG